MRTNIIERIRCAAAEAESIRAFLGTDLPSGVPDNIQWMPPGEHDISPIGSDDKPVHIRVRVDETLADRVAASFRALKAKSEKGEGDLPYFDFNHEDGEASAHPTEFYWGGDDPQTGGIRAKVEWTDEGEAAIKGKRFRRFSPEFLRHEKTGEIVGLTENMGGLVNRAAFRNIQPIWAKDASGDLDPEPEKLQHKKEEKETMKGLMKILAKLGLITSEELEESAAVSQVTQNVNLMTAKAAKADVLAGELKEIQADLVTAKETAATAIVDAAIDAGRLPGQNETIKAKWVNLIAADPTNAELLPSAGADITKTVVKAKPGEKPAVSTSETGEHAIVTKAKAMRKDDPALSEEEALAQVIQTHPGLYEDYRAKMFGIEIV